MKKICLIPAVLLSACTATTTISNSIKYTTKHTPQVYSTTMYAKGNLAKHDTGCLGCHIHDFDRVNVIVEEVLSNDSKVMDACHIEVTDSLDLVNIKTDKYVPLQDSTTCETLFNKEKSYLKAMGFAE